MWYLVKGKDAPFHLRLSRMKPDVHLWGIILSLGLASFIMQVANAVINTILNQTLAYYGAMDPVLSLWQQVHQLYIICQDPMFRGMMMPSNTVTSR